MLETILTGYIQNVLSQAEYDKLENDTFSGRVLGYKRMIAFGNSLREPGKFIVKLNEGSIPTRYPESLANLQGIYSRVVVKDILSKGRELVTWIKQQL